VAGSKSAEERVFAASRTSETTLRGDGKRATTLITIADGDHLALL
jgi:hypothetical protein